MLKNLSIILLGLPFLVFCTIVDPKKPTIQTEQFIQTNLTNSLKDTLPDDVYQVVEEMPRFPGCEDITGSNDAKKQCADKKMLEFLYRNIKYPTIARENAIIGVIVIRFIINKDGSISDTKIIRDPGAGLGDEGLRVVNKMKDLPQKWTPGKQKGQPVRVAFHLPIRLGRLTD